MARNNSSGFSTSSNKKRRSKNRSRRFKGHQNQPVNPKQTQALHEQQTADEARVGYIRRELAEHPSRGLTPARLHQILEAAEQGDLRAQHELFLDMEEKDAQISADLDKRILAAAELEWQIIPPENPTPQEQACADFCISAAGIIPEGMSIDFLTAADGKSDMFEAMLHWCERAKSKAILGGTLASGTGEGTNTNALGKVHERGLQSLVRSDARQYSSSIRKYILQPLAMLNFGITDLNRVPTFYLDTSEPEDILAFSQSVPALVSQGMKIPLWWAHEKTGIPQAAEDEAILQAPTMPNPYGFLKGAMVNTEALKAEPAVKAPAVSEALAQQLVQQSEPHIQNWLESLSAALDSAGSLEEAKAFVEAAFASLDSSELEEELAQALMASHLAGRSAVEDESGSD